ncbi:unnamed protein product [Ranitomeya imitator]|uniref:Uncharacterized protein n=1 Tax=Ranitomeya imitator TaxID=111125 RepID=A0ABN9LV72_9NEOB|nr:unnamed protein product [Ranitomeya imitator]
MQSGGYRRTEKEKVMDEALGSMELPSLVFLSVCILHPKCRHDCCFTLDANKVGIYLLEACLSKPEFLSEGHRRLKKSCIIIQKLMEKFHDFAIPDISDDNEEESDQELERQNIEELYDHVRQIHQREEQVLCEDVQHPALIPVLRPYQNEAVNWMLQRENFKNVPSNGRYHDHFL